MVNPVIACSYVWAVTQDGVLRYAPVKNQQWQKVKAISSPVVALAACEEYTAICVACDDGTLHIFHPETAELQVSSPNPLHKAPHCLLAVPLDNALFVGLNDGSLVRFHLSSLEFDCMLGCGLEHSAPINAMVADSRFLFTAGDDAVVLVWLLHDGSIACEISLPSAPVTSLVLINSILWMGLSNGAIEIFDVYGDDMRTIERLAIQAPHKGPVSDLIRIGEYEVWSVGTNIYDESQSSKARTNIAIWDTRDFSFKMSDDLNEDITSAVVVNRNTLQDVCILALTDSLGSTIVSKTVKGPDLNIPHEGTETMEMVSDLESQLQEAKAEIDSLKAEANQRDQNSDSVPADELASESDQDASSLPQEKGSNRSGKTIATMGTGSTPSTPARGNKDSSTGNVLHPSVSTALNNSLSKLSDLLVSMLSEEVIASKEADATQNSTLRNEIASVTKELNFVRELVTSVEEGSPNTNIFTSEETGPATPSRAEKSSTIESSLRELRKRLDEEIEKNRILEKDLTVVTNERDLFYDDLQNSRMQSESTVTSIEGVLRERTVALEKKDDKIDKLRNEYRLLERKLSERNRIFEIATEEKRQVELKLSEQNRKHEQLVEEIESLTNAATITTKSYDEKLTTAYSTLETKSIEIQSQRDSLRTADKQIDSLKTSRQVLQDKCNELSSEITTIQQNSAKSETDWKMKMDYIQNQHDDEINQLREELTRKLSEVQKDKQVLEHKSTEAHQNFVAQLESADRELESLRTDWGSARSELETIRGIAATKESQCEEIRQTWIREQESFEERIQELSIQLQSEQRHRLDLADQKEMLNTELMMIKQDLERTKREKENIEINMEINSSSRGVLQKSDIDNITEELIRIRQENELYQKEVEHRQVAEKAYQDEIERMKSVISNLRDVSEELKEQLTTADAEKENLSERICKMSDIVQGKEQRILELEKLPRSIPESTDSLRHSIAQDMSVVTEALLASAKGEIEQMTTQIDSLNRAHAAQEKELNELQEAVRWRDNAIREREIVLRKLISMSKNPSKLQAALKLSPIMDADGLRAINDNEGNSTYEEFFDAEAIKQLGDDAMVSDTLQELQDGMITTKARLKDLSGTARRYKRYAQSHLDILPALYAIEGELLRVVGKDSNQKDQLSSARGIVQSVIAQYYTSAEKKIVVADNDKQLYEPSRKRQDALDQIVLTICKLRMNKGSTSQSQRQTLTRTPNYNSPLPTYMDVGGGKDSTRRFLTYN